MIKTLAVVGATGAVGRIVLEEIIARGLPYERLKLLASARSAGKKVRVNGEEVIPIIRGSAYVTAELDLILDASDPFRFGIGK